MDLVIALNFSPLLFLNLINQARVHSHCMTHPAYGLRAALAGGHILYGPAEKDGKLNYEK